MLYALQGVDLGGGGSTCMFPRELIWEGVAPPVCSPGVDLGGGGSSSYRNETLTGLAQVNIV